MSLDVRSFWLRLLILSGLVGAASGLWAASAPAEPSALDRARIVQDYGKLPLRFEAGNGSEQGPQFLSRGDGYVLYLNSRGAILSLRRPVTSNQTSNGNSASSNTQYKSDIVRMDFNGANPKAHPLGEDLLPGVSNYFNGNNRSTWRTSVPAYSRVRYSSVYPGIDLVYYGNQRQLEYDFIVAPQADPGAIRLHFAGATQLSVSRGGELVIVSGASRMAFHKPVVYQVAAGKRYPVNGRFSLLADNLAGFTLGSYNHSRPLVIDPTLVYSTLLGGSNSDTLAAVAVDTAGNAYVTGSTASTDYPVTPGAFQVGYSTAFVSKLNPSGTALVYSTFLGSNAQGTAIAVNSAGDAYVTGSTTSTSFPVTAGVLQPTNKAAASSNSTGFVTKLNGAGTALLYSTYLGGTRTDQPLSLVLDPGGDAFIAGYAFSADFPVSAGAYQTTNKSASLYGWNEFVTKLNATATGILYSSYIGGSHEYGNGATIRVAVDASGDAYVSGSALSVDFPVTPGAYQTTNKAPNGHSNMTLSKLNSTGTKLNYSTYLGGSGNSYGDDVAYGLAVDSSGDAYLAGVTYETNYPVTSGAFQTTNKAATASMSNAFVTKMNASGTALIYSTYLGGSGARVGDLAHGLAIDSAGDAYVAGSTGSTDFPVTGNAYQSVNNASFNNGSNAFLIELNGSGSGLVYSTYLGGNSYDSATDIVLTAAGHVYLTGIAGSHDFPVTGNAYKTTYYSQNATTGFVTEFNMGTASSLTPTLTSVLSNANPAVSGTNMIFSATVAPLTGTGIPGGTVSFSINEVTVATVTLSSSGTATYSTSPLKAGQHYILASYSGNSTYAASAYGFIESITPAAPVISPPGGVYPAAQIVSLSDTTAGTAIYYTTDGSVPSSASTKYAGPILVATRESIRAIAVLPGVPSSAIANASYTLISAPSSLAAPATNIGTSSATFNAVVNTFGMTGSYLFRYGTSSTALTSSTASASLPGSPLGRIGFAPLPVNTDVTTLTTGTTYYYQIVLTTRAGTSSGAILSFTTK